MKAFCTAPWTSGGPTGRCPDRSSPPNCSATTRSLWTPGPPAIPGILDHYDGASLITRSHGQSCMAFFRSMYANRGIHFLDEPEAALSPKTQLELLDVIRKESRAGKAQFVISTHSPILMAGGRDGIYSFDGSRIERTALKKTSHYKVYRHFIDGL